MLRELGVVLSDRGSRYAVSGAPVADRGQIDAVVAELAGRKPYIKATHNTWGAILSDGGAAKADDGESGAGMIILRMLEREGLENHLVVVTRWYGGKHLGGDRFRHVQCCVRAYLDSLAGDTR